MCLILIAYHVHPHYPLIIAANRDEFFDRPTTPATFWQESPHVLAGRDLRSGGTWLGVSRTGRCAALTNFRDPRTMAADAPSRGQLVSSFLTGRQTPHQYLKELCEKDVVYNGYNLLFGTLEALYCHSNRSEQPLLIPAGIHGVSNGRLDDPWPKVQRGTEYLAHLVAAKNHLEPETLFTMLSDRTPVPDALLPDTGIGLAAERLLAPLFIAGTSYGTRSSTVVLFGSDNRITFAERTFNTSHQSQATHTFQFTIEPSTP